MSTSRVELHSNGLPIIRDHKGNYRVLAVKPPRAHVPLMRAKVAFPLLPQNQWQPILLADWDRPDVLDQGQASSCTGHGTGTSFEVACRQSGLVLPGSLSGCYVYSWINGGEDQGAIISDACLALRIHGCSTVATCPEGAIFRSGYNIDVADIEAATMLPEKVVSCYTWQEVFALVAMGFAVVIGITVGNNFADLDDEGVAPLPDVAAGGHCLAAVGLFMSKKYGLILEVQNSWTASFGDRGRCRLRPQHFGSITDAFGILAPKAGVHTSITPAA